MSLSRWSSSACITSGGWKVKEKVAQVEGLLQRESQLNLIIKFDPNQTYGFWEICVKKILCLLLFLQIYFDVLYNVILIWSSVQYTSYKHILISTQTKQLHFTFLKNKTKQKHPVLNISVLKSMEWLTSKFKGR